MKQEVERLLKLILSTQVAQGDQRAYKSGHLVELWELEAGELIMSAFNQFKLENDQFEVVNHFVAEVVSLEFTSFGPDINTNYVNLSQSKEYLDRIDEFDAMIKDILLKIRGDLT